MNVVYIKTFDNGKKYVGITNDFKKRMRQHKYDAYTRDSQFPVHRAMRKYSHETDIVFQSELYDDVKDKEVLIIQSLKDTGYEVYNVTNGGDGTVGRKHTEEAKEKLRKANTGKKASEETKKKMSIAFKGRKHTEETKKKMSEAQKQKTYTEEEEKHMSESRKGLKHPQAKTLEYYESKATTRYGFKDTCKRKGWNFSDFTEEFSGERTSNNHKKYFYKLK